MKTLEILISAAVAFSFGLIWYGVLFKKHWPTPTSPKDLHLQGEIFRQVLIYLSLCVVAYFMNNGCLETHINGGDLGHGVFHGGLYGLSYAVPIIAIHHVYQRKSPMQFIVDAGFVLLCFGAIGGMLALLTLMVY
jgi:hypothetical protein